MKHIMIDLETMSTKPNAAIVAIGACEIFSNEDAWKKGDSNRKTFYQVVDLGVSLEAGFHIDADTVYWWMKQSEEARMHLLEKGEYIGGAILKFAEWAVYNKEWPCVWGNGASFDNIILRSAFDACSQQAWPYWNDRCYRTMKNLLPHVELKREGTYHNALDDAISQAKHLETMLQANNIEIK